ncbi:MAG: hypothetical protein JXR07_16090 [Reichenbachiella sp.]
MRNLTIFSFILIILNSCGNLSNNKLVDLEENAPLPGFNIEESDAEAVMLADKVMAAMGGRKAWDDTKIICWTFFEKRRLVWNKHTGDVRITDLKSDQVTIVNIHSLEGKVFKNGKELTQPDSLARYLKKGKSIWINDSYWLVMPFKLKDTGVTLHYIGEDTLDNGQDAFTFQMTFKNVGNTPDNVYNIWVDAKTKLIGKWAFFRSFEDTEPSFTTPWLEYERYEDILLSSSRGKGNMSNIKVLDSAPNGTFSSLEKIDI